MSRVMREFYENGYGVNVIDHGYGADEGLFELAVLQGNSKQHHLCYDTPITSDVEGWLTWASVEALVERVKAL